MKSFLICFLFANTLFLCSCREVELRASEYIKYVERENNHLNRAKQVGDLHFHLQYCPTEYLLLKEHKTDKLSKQLVEERRMENDSMLFFKLRITANGSTDVLNYQLRSGEDYYARIQYLSYGFEEDIALIHERDTIFPALFHFERTYGVVPFADFMMAFNTKIKESGDFQVIIDDKVFDTGILKFTYKTDDIQNIPKLITK